MQQATARLARAAAVLTTAGVVAFGLGAVPALAAGPATTVTPTTGADPAGQDIRVTGSGFDPNRNNKFGIYVVFGPKNPDYATNASAYQKSKWVHLGATPSAGQDVLNADGTFDTTLTGIKAQYTDGNGNAVNCLTTQCYIITMAAHGVPDRSQDTFTPVAFTGGNPNPGGGSGSGTQQLSAEVSAGALTLSLAGNTAQLSTAPAGGHATGALQKAKVSDSRGTRAGWSLVGELTDFTVAQGGSIPAANLAWTPSAQAVNDGSQGTVTPGASGSFGAARTLASSPAGSSGGVFETGAALDLSVPAGASVGVYNATLTLTLS